MIFNSTVFLVFFVLFFMLYWLVCSRHLKLQNYLLLTGSYIFYGWTDWRLLLYLVIVSALNFYLGLGIGRYRKYRSLLLYTGLVFSVGSLAYLKYFNFFIDSFRGVLDSLPVHLNHSSLNIIVPLGISFYTFKTISYLLDIDKGKMEAATDWLTFFAYMAFFPTVLSGPIDRAKNFLPQLEKKRLFSYQEAGNGMRQLLWGLFKKMVVADNCASIVDPIYENHQHLPGSTLLIAAFLYAIQMYADFSGYSDMAIGISRLLGFKVTRNFDNPFFARNIADYWRRWHISLTSWLTEYVFTPLSIAFRDYGKTGLSAAVIINFIIVGLWHGANWTFVLFGLLHGCYFIPLILKGTFNKRKKHATTSQWPGIAHLRDMAGVFILATFTFIIFRAASVSEAVLYIRHIFSRSLLQDPVIPLGKLAVLITLFFSSLMFITEWINRDKEHGLYLDHIRHPLARTAVYYLLIFMIVFFDANTNNQFIYFQF